jgi:hypothetical protein
MRYPSGTDAGRFAPAGTCAFIVATPASSAMQTIVAIMARDNSFGRILTMDVLYRNIFIIHLSLLESLKSH